ncbi:hypothetical protein GCM10023169_13520 [Georgenia halophila]|uniref:DUF3017 domain-containing protein n=2 Tax=Georgenia halophila TaxID=620889 RepID=A0ABP8L2Q6_9MICO
MTALTAVLGTLVAVCLLTVLVRVSVAIVVLAAALAAAGLVRAVSPTAVIPGARSRAFDVAFLLVLAAALGYLSLWGNATVVGG